MVDFGLNGSANVQLMRVGRLNTPVLVIDDFAVNPQDLQQYAIEQGQFVDHGKDYYPGKRCIAPQAYQHNLVEFLQPMLSMHFADMGDKLCCLLSAFSITTTPVEKLKPIQMLPHFDNAANNQFAVVHYLAAGGLNTPTSEPGGTAFYRHITTGLERITQNHLANYAQVLKQQAVKAQLHQTPGYISAMPKSAPHWQMFEQIEQVSHKYNRAVIYPANLLHSGVINLQLLNANPREGRLTLNSFLCFS